MEMEFVKTKFFPLLTVEDEIEKLFFFFFLFLFWDDVDESALMLQQKS